MLPEQTAAGDDTNPLRCRRQNRQSCEIQERLCRCDRRQTNYI